MKKKLSCAATLLVTSLVFPLHYAAGGDARVLNLGQCLQIARENNRSKPASRYSVEIAEAQLGQALSSYWPQLSARASVLRLDDDPNFVLPEMRVTVPATTILAGTPVGPLPVSVPAQTVTVPEQDIKLMSRDSALASLNLVYPVYTGGLRPALVKRAESGVAAARQEARRTDLQVVYDVKRFYYGAVLAKKLSRVAADSLARMEVTLQLTENLYKGGSTRVKKTDYLRNKSVVEALRSTLAFLKGNERLTLAALTNSLGLPWDSEIDVFDADIPFRPYAADLKKLVGNAYSFSPDWARLEEGIKATEAQVDEKKAGFFPKVALIGNLTHIENSYDKGMATPRNKDTWSVGVGLELPLFNGFRTRAEVAEAKARLGKIREQEILFREGIALQVKDVLIQMVRGQEQRNAMEAASKAAGENRDLNERAYQEELVETKDVIEAQLVDSFMSAANEKTLYDHIEAQARLEFVVGRELEFILEQAPKP
ncbi:MAG: TolC family protein [Thermoanaerobaculia bacterium]|jgi:outer membrane protein TolC